MSRDQYTHSEDHPNWLFVGLGNVGSKYEGTRHNIGFDVIDNLAEALGLEFHPARGEYYVASNLEVDKPKPSLLARLFRRRLTSKNSDSASSAREESFPSVALVKPTTFMNRSGLALQQTLKRYQLPQERILVVCDDLNLPLGAVRIRAGGSDGGHNGIRSIIETLGTTEFPRMRIGVGLRPEGIDIVPFVLSRFVEIEETKKQGAVRHAVAALRYLLAESSDNSLAMTASKYNISRPDPAPGSGGTGE